MRQLTLTVLLLTVWLHNSSASAQTICSSETGYHGGLYYTHWSDGVGSACMTLGPGGNYGYTWSNVGNFVGGKGWNPGNSNRIIGYNAGYVNLNGTSYLNLYGWSTNPLIEYYVVDTWGDWRPPGGTPVATLYSDGGTYELYRTLRVNKPSIQGTQTFYQYWSVRTSKRPQGTNNAITFQNHVRAWEEQGWFLGTHNYQVMGTEGYQSSGGSNLTVWNAGSSSNSKTIVVRAKGTTGSERIRLKINNTTVATWILSTGMKDYIWSGNDSGGSLVEFDNDAGNRDVQVDYIKVNGVIRQSEQQTYNTGVWQNGCGNGSFSEWLHCNGAIGYGPV